MRDKYGVLPTPSPLHITVECLQECGDTVKYISTTERGEQIPKFNLIKFKVVDSQLA